jgi:hypothetical protein
MKQSSLMLSLIITGRRSPSFKIDVYLEPLILELKELWDVGEPTYDVSSNEMFTMCSVLMWTINDFPAYGDLSGLRTKGRYACPCCVGNTKSKWLKYGTKFCYIGHRQYLPMDHRWRKKIKLLTVPKNWIIHRLRQLAMKYGDKFNVLIVLLRLLGKGWVLMSDQYGRSEVFSSHCLIGKIICCVTILM